MFQHRCIRQTVYGLLALTIVALAASPAEARILPIFRRHQDELQEVNQRINGRVVDLTNNHGCDRRIYSRALCEKRSMYVYEPPGYCGTRPYPVMIWLHGNSQDETTFLKFVQLFDAKICKKEMPPMVIAAPDGNITDTPFFRSSGSFWVNSKAGRFSDYLLYDILPFVENHFAVYRHAQARVLAGASMGGFGAFNNGFKYPELFPNIVGIMPVLNVRYINCRGRYFANYDPYCVDWRTNFSRNRAIGRFYGVIVIRERRILDPLLDYRRDDVLGFLLEENPVELMINRSDFLKGTNMFVGYGTRDEFNLDAQAQQFQDIAESLNLNVDLVEVPRGRHNMGTGEMMFPALAQWLTQHVGQYTPPGYEPYCTIAGPRERRPIFPILRRRATPTIQSRIGYGTLISPIPGLPIPTQSPLR